MNDISRSSDILFSQIFADDTYAFIEGTILNKDLENVNIYLNVNTLTLNIKNTYYFVFKRHN